MQQTAVAVAETKDQIIVDVEQDLDLVTILVSGLSYFSYAVAATLVVLAVVDVMTAVCGSSSYCSSVAVSAETEAVAAADATTVATRIR